MRLAQQHRVLKAAEVVQGVGDEPVARGLRARAGDVPAELVQPPDMAGETGADEGDHLLRHCVRFGVGRLRQEQVGLCRGAVLGVEVPAVAGGLVAVHQQAGLAPDHAVEMLHDEAAAARGPGLELLTRDDEAVVGEQVHRHAESRGPVLHLVPQPPFARLGHGDAVRAGVAQRVGHGGAQVGGGVGVVDAAIGDAPARRPQFGSEVAHRGKDQHQFLLVVVGVARLGRDLGHQHRVARRIGVAQGRDPRRQLVAEDQDQARLIRGHRRASARRWPWPTRRRPGCPRRDASPRRR